MRGRHARFSRERNDPDASGFAVVETVDTISVLSRTTALATTKTIIIGGIYQVNAYLNINSISTDVLKTNIQWTDEGGTSRSADFYPQGATSSSIAVTGPANYPPMTIYCKGGTNLTFNVIFVTGTGSVNYNFYGRAVHL